MPHVQVIQDLVVFQTDPPSSIGPLELEFVLGGSPMFAQHAVLACLRNGTGEIVLYRADVDIATGINIAPNIRAAVRSARPNRIGRYTRWTLFRFPVLLRARN